MYVAPTWAELWHDGLIVALFVPGTSIPCTPLGPGSLLRVVLQRPRSLTNPCSGSPGDALRLARETQQPEEAESVRLAKRPKGDDGQASDRADEKELSHASPGPREEGKTYYDTSTGEISLHHSGDTPDSERGSDRVTVELVAASTTRDDDIKVFGLEVNDGV